MASAPLTREDVLAFLNRDWALIRRVKDAATGQRIRDRGASAAFALSQMLLDQTWSRMRDQPSDVEGLLRYREAMDRAAATGR